MLYLIYDWEIQVRVIVMWTEAVKLAATGKKCCAQVWQTNGIHSKEDRGVNPANKFAGPLQYDFSGLISSGM